MIVGAVKLAFRISRFTQDYFTGVTNARDKALRVLDERDNGGVRITRVTKKR